MRRVYGQANEQYDNLFFGLIKTKADKKKAKQHSSQRDASIDLTRKQSQKVAAEADAATFNAKAARAKAFAAERLAEMTTIQLEGAQATVQLKNTALAFGVVLVTCIVAGAIYLIRESKKKAQLEADKMQMKVAPTPTYKQ